MAEQLRRLLGSGPAAWTGLGGTQQLLLLALGLLLAVVLFVGSQWFWDGQYVPLFASLSAEDAGAIVAQLKASKTPYRIGGAGEQILVPADAVNEARLRMAMQGLPLGGGVGFEVFDKVSFGMSDFTQRLNYQRALQGELARTIGQLREVSRARVHLVLPQPSLFTERDRPPSASVFLKLAPGARLGGEQVRGIVHLVASSVEGLSPDRVTVVDTAGRVLSMGGEAGGGQLSPRRGEIKTAVEEGLERRVQSLLDSALGPGQAVTRVSAQLNFDQVERTEERFDPNPVTRQETRTVETSKGSSSTPTTPTAPTGTPAAGTPQTATNVTSNEGSRESESVSYELSKIVARTLTTPGEIQRLSVAVLLNTNTKVTEAADKREVREPVPRPAEEIEKIRRVVMGAVGYNQARGDEVTVVEMPFDSRVLDRERALLDQAGPAPGTRAEGVGARPWISSQTIVLAAVLLFGILCVVWLMRGQSRKRALAEVARSFDKQETAPSRLSPTSRLSPQPASQPAPTPSAPLHSEESLRVGRERDDLRQKALGMASGEPEATAQLLRAWMVKKKSSQPAWGGRDAS